MNKTKLIFRIILPLAISLSACGNSQVDTPVSESTVTISPSMPVSEETSTQEPASPEVSEDTETAIDVIPLEINGHRFDEVDKYGNKEVQLIILFNRALSSQEIGTAMVPTYTYKYSLSTKEGDDFIVDYGKGNSLSEIFFNENFTEYEIANSGNGMREGKYASNPLFNQDNILSIKIEIYKKCNDDKYNHDYELIDEYLYSVDNDTAEKTNSSN